MRQRTRGRVNGVASEAVLRAVNVSSRSGWPKMRHGRRTGFTTVLDKVSLAAIWLSHVTVVVNGKPINVILHPPPGVGSCPASCCGV